MNRSETEAGSRAEAVPSAEPFLIYADRKAREIADKQFGPITLTPNRRGWWTVYWTCMGGYGFAPYYIGAA